MTVAFVDADRLTEPDPKQLLLAAFTGYHRARARNVQRSIGPSEVGTECLRALACKVAEIPATATEGDPGASFMGTASHLEAAQALLWDNAQLASNGQPQRWLSEIRVESPIAGTADCVLLGEVMTVIDFKFPGRSTFDKTVKGGPSPVYRTQVHFYAEGLRRMGLPVGRVGILFVCRDKPFYSSHWWTEDFDPEVVREGISRMETAAILAHDLDIIANPQAAQHLPITPGEYCRWCEWHDPQGLHTDRGGCRGQNKEK